MPAQNEPWYIIPIMTQSIPPGEELVEFLFFYVLELKTHSKIL